MFSYQLSFSFVNFSYMSFACFYSETLFFLVNSYELFIYMDINTLSLSLFIVDFCVKKFKIFVQSKSINISFYDFFPWCSAFLCELVNWPSALIYVKLAIVN